MPVPIVSPTTSVAPRAAPKRCSTSVVTFASLSMKTGQPEPLRHHVAEREVGESAGSPHITATPGALVDQAGDAEADRLDVADLRSRSSDTASTIVSTSLLLEQPVDRRGGRGRAPRAARRRRRRAAWCRRGRPRSPCAAHAWRVHSHSGTIEAGAAGPAVTPNGSRAALVPRPDALRQARIPRLPRPPRLPQPPARPARRASASSRRRPDGDAARPGRPRRPPAARPARSSAPPPPPAARPHPGRAAREPWCRRDHLEAGAGLACCGFIVVLDRCSASCSS